MKTLYTATVKATGGRNGVVKSDDGVVDFKVGMPKSLGGASDDMLNPELLFASGYAACFDSALNKVLRTNRIKADTSVTAHVSIGQTDNGGFQLAAALDVTISDVTIEVAHEMTQAAHQVCPYSVATRGNMEVVFNVTNI